MAAPPKSWQIWSLQSAGWGYCALATATPSLPPGMATWHHHLPRRDRYGEAKTARLAWIALQMRRLEVPGGAGAKRPLRCIYQPWSLQFLGL